MSETKQNYDGKPNGSGGKQLPHDGAPPTEQTSRLEDD